MKAKELLAAAQRFAFLQGLPSDQLIQQCTDEQLKTAILVTAELFRTVKVEAERRGIWDELKTKKVS